MRTLFSLFMLVAIFTTIACSEDDSISDVKPEENEQVSDSSQSDNQSNVAPDEATNETSSDDETTNDGIDKAIESINQEVEEKGVELEFLTREHFLNWFDEFVYFATLKHERKTLIKSIKKGELPEYCNFSIREAESGLPACLMFEPYNLPLIEGLQPCTYIQYLEGMQKEYDPELSLANEPFHGIAPFENPPVFSQNTNVRITEIQVQGTSLVPGYEARDALKIEILISDENINDVLDYFSTGFDRIIMQQRLDSLLDIQNNYWIDIKDVFPNWLSNKINTFPVEGDNEVCHGAAREFYYTQQDCRINASTEATSLLLHNYYKRIPESANPVFGDYLYIPGMHSGRYIMQDPDSKRHICFSVQSGGFCPYRFYWIDEDFSGDPFAHTPKENLFSTHIDVWRRSK